MTIPDAVQQPRVESFDEQVESIMEELNLAIKWNRYSVLLVVSNAECVRTDAEAVLEEYLNEQGQKVAHIATGELPDTRIASLLLKHQATRDQVFFIHGADPKQRNMLAKLGTHKDILTQRNIRLVVWITANGLVDLARNAPEIWECRQRVIELPDMPSSEHILQDAIESVWQGVGEYADPFEDTEEKINLRESVLTGLPQKAESTSTRAKMLLTLGILNWRKGNHEKSVELLEDAIKAAVQMEDSWFESECFNAIALVKFAQGKNNEAIEAYKQAIKIAPDQLFVWNNLGNLCLKIMRNDEATFAFQKTLQHNPRDPIAWNGLGTVYYRIGYTDDSIAAFRKAIEYAPLLAQPWAGLGDVYASTGRDLDAITAYQKATELNKDLTAPWLRLADIYSRQGRHRDAIKTYQRVLAMNPQNYKVWNELGLVLLKTNSFEEAMHAFLKSIEIDGSFGWAYSNLAIAYARQGMYLDAIEACRKSLQIFTDDSDKIEAWDRLANFYRAINDYDNAMQAYQTIDKLKGSPPPVVKELISCPPSPAPDTVVETHPATSPAPQDQTSAEMEESPEVIETTSKGMNGPAWIFQPEAQEQIETMSTTFPEAFFWKDEMSAATDGRTAKNKKPQEEPMNTQDLASACPTHQAVSSLGFSEESFPKDPFENKEEIAESRDPEVWNKKGNIHFQNREYELAISAYNKAIELDRSFGWPYVNLAHTYLNLGKYAEAVLLYQKSTSLLKKNEEKAVAWNNLGNIYRHLSEYDNALTAYQKADELDPQNAGRRDNTEITSLKTNSRSAQVWLELGNLFFKSGSYKESAEAYANSIEIDPASGWAHSNLAMALVFQGEYQEAVSVYLKSIELFSGAKDKAVTWNRLGNVYRKMNDEDNARKAYRTAVALSNEKMDLLTRTRFSLLGNCYAN
ncbi:MAG: tetratricopeptide repeat protein [Chloroflexi bacterium]|nr:tetratricopeptide repeat protein [Chloroflexota bacterium]